MVFILSLIFSIVLGESFGKNRSLINRQVVPYRWKPIRTSSVSSGVQKFFFCLLDTLLLPKHLDAVLRWFEEDTELFWTVRWFSFSGRLFEVLTPRRLTLGPIESSESSSTIWSRCWNLANFNFFRFGVCSESSVELLDSSSARLRRPLLLGVDWKLSAGVEFLEGPGTGESCARDLRTVRSVAPIGVRDGTLFYGFLWDYDPFDRDQNDPGIFLHNIVYIT